MRGISPCVQQEEVKTHHTLLDSMHGTVKVAKLQDDPECPCLIASSVYDIDKTCALSQCLSISMITEKVEWIKKEKDVYNIEIQHTN